MKSDNVPDEIKDKLNRKKNVSVRYHRSGTALQITYTIDDGDKTQQTTATEDETLVTDLNGDNNIITNNNEVPNDKKAHVEIELDDISQNNGHAFDYRKLSEASMASIEANTNVLDLEIQDENEKSTIEVKFDVSQDNLSDTNNEKPSEESVTEILEVAPVLADKSESSNQENDVHKDSVSNALSMDIIVVQQTSNQDHEINEGNSSCKNDELADPKDVGQVNDGFNNEVNDANDTKC